MRRSCAELGLAAFSGSSTFPHSARASLLKSIDARLERRQLSLLASEFAQDGLGNPAQLSRRRGQS